MIIELETFLKNLILTQIYCEQRVEDEIISTSKIQRSLQLEYNQKRIFEFEWNEEYSVELTKWKCDIEENNFFVIKRIFDEQINLKKQLVGENKLNEFKGRVLISEFESAIWDGVSEIESNGLIDYLDLPGIDSWFYLTKRDNRQLIFAWIPEKLVKEADKAIAVNALGVLAWLNNWDNELFLNLKNQKEL